MTIQLKKHSFITKIEEFVRSKGGRCALPVYILLFIGFVAPLFMVLGFSFAEPRSFHAFTSFTLENFIHIFDGSSSVWRSFAWSIGLAAFVTAVLAVVCYPVAVGMVRVFGKGMSTFISILFVFPLFVSENVRLYGWILFFGKNGGNGLVSIVSATEHQLLSQFSMNSTFSIIYELYHISKSIN